MCLVQRGAGCPIEVEPTLAKTDHLWQEHFIHETPPSFQEPSYSSVTFTRSAAGEIRDGVVRQHGRALKELQEGEGVGYCESGWRGHCEVAGREL